MSNNIRCHVGIPKFLINRFANEKKEVAVWNLTTYKSYYAAPKNIGIEKNHYTAQTEKALSKTVEAPFSSLLLELDNEKELYEKTNILNKNIKIIENFVKFQFMRAKKTLEKINDTSISASIFRNYTHSKLLEITTIMSSNPILMIPSPWQLLMLEASEIDLINSSLGLYFIPETNTSLKNDLKYIIIPISKSEAICISHTLKEPYSHYEIKGEEIKKINKICLVFETYCGNGFLLANNTNDFNDLQAVLELK